MTADYFKSIPEKLPFWGLTLFAATVNLSVSLCEAGIVLALLGLIINAARKRKAPAFPAFGKPLAYAWLAFFIVAIVTASFALFPARAFGYMPSDLFKCAGFFIFLLALKKDDAPRLGNIYLAGACAAALFGIYQVITVGGRAHATVHPVTYGELIATALVLALCLFAGAAERKKTFIYAAVSALLGLALLLSQTRGAMLGLGVAMVLLIACGYGRKRILVLAAMLALLGIGTVAARPQLMARFRNPLAASRGPQDVSATAVNSRISMWHTGMEIWRDYPVLGVGQSNLVRVFDYYHPSEIEGNHGWGNVHSLYIQFLAERGIAGLAALLAVFVLMWRLAILAYKKAATPFTAWALCLLPGFYVMNLTETSFQHAVIAFSALFAAACAAAFLRADN